MLAGFQRELDASRGWAAQLLNERNRVQEFVLQVTHQARTYHQILRSMFDLLSGWRTLHRLGTFPYPLDQVAHIVWAALGIETI